MFGDVPYFKYPFLCAGENALRSHLRQLPGGCSHAAPSSCAFSSKHPFNEKDKTRRCLILRGELSPAEASRRFMVVKPLSIVISSSCARCEPALVKKMLALVAVFKYTQY